MNPARPWTDSGRLRAVRARDILAGYVRAVIDERTIDVNILDATPEQRERYQGSEVMRLVGAVVESAADDPARAAEVARRLHHQRVRCFVHGRDDDGRLVAVVVPVSGRSGRGRSARVA